MSDAIQVNEGELAAAIHMLNGCADEIIPESSSRAPTPSSMSVAMDEFLYQMFNIGVLVAQYKELLQNDLSVLETSRATFAEADAAVAKSIES